MVVPSPKSHAYCKTPVVNVLLLVNTNWLPAKHCTAILGENFATGVSQISICFTAVVLLQPAELDTIA